MHTFNNTFMFIPWHHTRIALGIIALTSTLIFWNDLSLVIYRARDQRPAELHQVVESEDPPLASAGLNLNHTILPVDLDPWDSSKFVVGSVTDHFRDNLRQDTMYVTTWTDAGFTNEFMTYVNLIYLGIISERVPIVPPFVPFHHVTAEAGILPFSDVFDLDNLRKALRTPVLEWSDIQSPISTITPPSPPEHLGCWSAWATSNPKDNRPRTSDRLVNYLNLDVSYTPVPMNTRRRLDKEGEWDWQLLFWPLSSLIFPVAPSAKSPTNAMAGKGPAMFASPLGSQLPPDEHLACFDFLYFVVAGREEDDEWNFPWCPAWRIVGQHLKFTEPLLELGKGYIRRAFEVMEDELPPFIAVHVRHGDFDTYCNDAPTLEECFAPISAYARRVKEIQQELLETQGLEILDQHVILTSDEEDPAFWSQVTAQGWKYINHTAEHTLELHGEWYVTIVDVVAQSLGMGFVGTHQSTVSMVSQRRVEVWNGGVTRMVQWGRLGADDH